MPYNDTFQVILFSTLPIIISQITDQCHPKDNPSLDQGPVVCLAFFVYVP